MGRAVVPGRREGVAWDSGSGWAYVFRPKGDSLSLNAPQSEASVSGMGLTFPLTLSIYLAWNRAASSL